MYIIIVIIIVAQRTESAMGLKPNRHKDIFKQRVPILICLGGSRILRLPDCVSVVRTLDCVWVVRMPACVWVVRLLDCVWVARVPDCAWVVLVPGCVWVVRRRWCGPNCQNVDASSGIKCYNSKS